MKCQFDVDGGQDGSNESNGWICQRLLKPGSQALLRRFSRSHPLLLENHDMFTAKQGGADTAPPQVSVRPDGCRWGAGRICLASSHMKDSSNIEQHTNRSLGNPEIGELKFNDNDLAELFYALARIPKHPTVTLNERTAKGCPHPFLTRKPNMFWLVVSTPLKNMSSSIEIILHNL